MGCFTKHRVAQTQSAQSGKIGVTRTAPDGLPRPSARLAVQPRAGVLLIGPRRAPEPSMLYPQEFDVIVVGGGHAGTEAAFGRCPHGLQNLLLPQHRDPGADELQPQHWRHWQGHLVKRWTLGGAMALATDEGGGIQFRTLNSSRPGRARYARDRPHPLQSRHPPHAGEPAQPVAVPAGVMT